MKTAFTFLVIIVLLVGSLYVFSNTARYVANRPTPTPRGGAQVKQTPRPSPSVTPTPSGPEPDTFITSGPNEGEVLEIESVAFRFSGVFPEGDVRNLRFETKIEGIDKDWRASSGGARTVRLPAGSNTYTFMVRAKTPDGRMDATPASRKFVSNLSPYFGKVTISSITPFTLQEKIVIRHAFSERTPIEITGWRIRSVNEEVVIPQAVQLFSYNTTNLKESVKLDRTRASRSIPDRVVRATIFD